MEKEILIEKYFEKGFLIGRSLLESDTEIRETAHPFLLILNKDNLDLGIDLKNQEPEKDQLLELDHHRVRLEKEDDSETYFSFINSLKKRTPELSSYSCIPVCSYENTSKKFEVRDFTNIFVSRYRFMENLLRTRPELNNILSVSRLSAKKDQEAVSLIGLVYEITEVKSGNLIITLEDLTGKINLIIPKSRQDLYRAAKDLVLDEVIGVTGTVKGQNLFAESILWPEVPLNQELKCFDEEIYAVFLSDIHVGSNNFLAEEFDKLIGWLSGNVGNDTQKEIAKKVKFLFIVGDLVDGIGIYPDQDKELVIKDIYSQYQAAADLLRKIPSYIQIVICPGNHDALHLAEPQPAFNPQHVQPLIKLPNVLLTSNPALVNICQNKNFSGFDVLLYHGYSFDYYVANVDSIRSSGGYERADLIMKFLLKRRHLAPSFTSTPYLPAHPEDPLIIRKIPDFFITGHIHYSIAANYRGITMISGSCWQSKTSFQEKVGHEPQPARVPLVNLKTREVKIIKFT